jgi:hypothetical protein
LLTPGFVFLLLSFCPAAARADLVAADVQAENFDLSHWKLTLPLGAGGGKHARQPERFRFGSSADAISYAA